MVTPCRWLSFELTSNLQIIQIIRKISGCLLTHKIVKTDPGLRGKREWKLCVGVCMGAHTVQIRNFIFGFF